MALRGGRELPGLALVAPRHTRGYVATSSEFLDHSVTRGISHRADVLCSADPDDPTQLIISAAVRGRTSTKSYCTPETEVVATEFIRHLEQAFPEASTIESFRIHSPDDPLYDRHVGAKMTSTSSSQGSSLSVATDEGEISRSWAKNQTHISAILQRAEPSIDAPDLSLIHI